MSDPTPAPPQRDIILQNFETWAATLQPHEIQNDHERRVAIQAWRAALRESVPASDLVRQLLMYGPAMGLTGGCAFCPATLELVNPLRHSVECVYRRVALLLVP